MNPSEIATEILQGLENGLPPRKDYLESLSKRFVQLDHFLSDSDIRAKDEGYREMQENCLRKFLRFVAQRENEKAESISFLFECK